MDEPFALQAVFDELLDRAHAKAVGLAELFEIVSTCHLSIFAHDLDDQRRRMQPGEARKIKTPFGLSGAHKHAPIPSAERVDMSWADKIIGASRGVDSKSDGLCAIRGGDSRPHAMFRVPIDRDGHCGATQCGVGRRLGVEGKPIAVLIGERQAQVARCQPSHGVDFLGGRVLSREDQIALVFPVFIINKDNELATADIFKNVRDGAEHARGMVVTFAHAGVG